LTRLGGPAALWGRSAWSGSRVWQRNLRLRLWIGPLRSKRFQDFLPGGEAAAALAKWLTLLGGDSLEYQVRLTLHRDDVRPVSLGAASGGEIGRASCRERVEMAVGDGAVEKEEM